MTVCLGGKKFGAEVKDRWIEVRGCRFKRFTRLSVLLPFFKPDAGVAYSKSCALVFRLFRKVLLPVKVGYCRVTLFKR